METTKKDPTDILQKIKVKVHNSQGLTVSCPEGFLIPFIDQNQDLTLYFRTEISGKIDVQLPASSVFRVQAEKDLGCGYFLLEDRSINITSNLNSIEIAVHKPEKLETEDKEEEIVEELEKKNKMKISLDGENRRNYTEGSLELSGKVDTGAQKITILWDGDNTPYTLKKFKEGDTSWTYIIDKSFGNIKTGKNRYIITAVFPEGSQETLKVDVDAI